LGDSELIYTARERRRGYLDECRERDLEATADLVVTGLGDDAAAARAVSRLLDTPNPPTAVFSAQNLITIGAIAALRAAGAGRAIALVGFDDIPMAEHLALPVTVVAQDPSAIGRRAAEIVFARLEGDSSAATEIVVPTRLIARGSGEISPA
ncbi:MAG TPA: substrate-binding domain-containing protein, partial [Arachnia sp.]|nr:substrate-binding domain-containing protein [Arachnia sp.]